MVISERGLCGEVFLFVFIVDLIIYWNKILTDVMSFLGFDVVDLEAHAQANSHLLKWVGYCRYFLILRDDPFFQTCNWKYWKDVIIKKKILDFICYLMITFFRAF